MTNPLAQTDPSSQQAISELDGEAPCKPRFAIMGEFSAGKSTLSNLLIGAPALPVKVTATQLPPVWISYGNDAPYRVDIDGTEHPFDFADMADLSLDDTLCIRVFHESDALELCDLIDMPGISDPNMSSQVWERALHLADGVVWCSHATQAWRQSEAAVWSTVDPALYPKSLLLLTRIDKIASDRDRLRIKRRVEKEVDGLFAGVFPISLTDAIEAGEDHQAWQASGAEDFALAMIDIVESIADAADSPAPWAAIPAQAPLPEPEEAPPPTGPVQPDRLAAPIAPEPSPCASAKPSILTLRKPAQQDVPDQPRIVPQRITRAGRGERPTRPVRSRNSLSMY